MTIVKDFFSISAVLILSGNIGHLYKLVYTNIIFLTMLHQIVCHKNEYTKKLRQHNRNANMEFYAYY